MAVLTHTWMSAPSNATEESFQKWAKGLHDALLAIGLKKSDDLGQVENFDSDDLPQPGSNNTAAGYNIFRLDDDLQGAYPIFIKVEYGRGTAATAGRIWITVGRGTDGEGEVVDTLWGRDVDSSSWQIGPTSEFMSYAVSDGSSFAVAPWAGHGGHGSFFLALERSRDEAGEATGEGVLIVFRGPFSTSFSVRTIAYDGIPGEAGDCLSQHLPIRFPFQINGQSGNTPSSMYFTSTLSRDGVHAPVLPVPCLAPGVTPWVSNLLTAVHPGDAGSLSVIQAAKINGKVRHYRAWAFANQASGTVYPTMLGSGTVTSWWPAILWNEESD